MAGRPAAASSAIVEAPARAITRCAASQPRLRHRQRTLASSQSIAGRRIGRPHPRRDPRCGIAEPRAGGRRIASGKAATAAGTTSLSTRAPSDPPSTRRLQCPTRMRPVAKTPRPSMRRRPGAPDCRSLRDRDAASRHARYRRNSGPACRRHGPASGSPVPAPRSARAAGLPGGAAAAGSRAPVPRRDSRQSRPPRPAASSCQDGARLPCADRRGRPQPCAPAAEDAAAGDPAAGEMHETLAAFEHLCWSGRRNGHR